MCRQDVPWRKRVKAPAIESVFLTRKPMSQWGASRRVLILGGDQTSMDLASRLAIEGFEVLLVGDITLPQMDTRIELRADTVVEEIQGFIGGFEVALRNGRNRRTERVGYIVAAQPARIVPKYGTLRSGKVSESCVSIGPGS